MMLALLLGVAVAYPWQKGRRLQDHDHHHAHGHGAASCGCEKDEADHPFGMDCAAASMIREAAANLTGCGTPSEANCKGKLEAGDPTCQAAFFILQAHHDYCDHETLTTDEEVMVHDWEAYCIQCAVYRGHDADLPTCPMIDCSNPQPAIDAHDALEAGCTKESADGADDGACCGDEDTQLAFGTVIAYHDLCDHDDIPQGVEEAVHDYEHSCEAYMCNVVSDGYDGTVCEDDYADGFLLGIGWTPAGVVDLTGSLAALGFLGAAVLVHA